MPAAARVRPPSATTHNFALLAVRHGSRNDLTPCRMALHVDYASASATTSSTRPAATATRGSSYTASLRYASCTPSWTPEKNDTNDEK